MLSPPPGRSLSFLNRNPDWTERCGVFWRCKTQHLGQEMHLHWEQQGGNWRLELKGQRLVMLLKYRVIFPAINPGACGRVSRVLVISAVKMLDALNTYYGRDTKLRCLTGQCIDAACKLSILVVRGACRISSKGTHRVFIGRERVVRAERMCHML